MNIDRIVLAFAGTVVLVSVGLAWAVSPYWLLLTGFVGLNMLQAAFTGFCPLAIVLKALGAKPGSAFPMEPRAASQVRLIEPATAVNWFNRGEAVIVDVREAAEYGAGHIPGSVLISLSSFDPGRVPVAPGKKLIFHCQSGMRCGPAAAQMVQSGFTGEINRLRGGLKAWAKAGGPVTAN